MRKTLLLAVVALALLAALLLLRPEPVLAKGFIVNSFFDDSDAHDANPGGGVCADTYGACTLRAAVEEANAWPGADTITFKDPMQIFIDGGNGSLAITDKVTIDASSVWHSVDDVPGVTINGKGGNFVGLYLQADACEIYGLYITDFGGSGLYVQSAGNKIGGTAAGQRNVLSGNGYGLTLTNNTAQMNVVRNNYIGLTPAGDAKNANHTGLAIVGGAKNNVIGGNEPEHANVISGNTIDGVVVEGVGTESNWLDGNLIGTSPTLQTDVGNGSNGLRIVDSAFSTVIGGLNAAGNFIAYNGISGIRFYDGGHGSEVSHNVIIGHKGYGVEINDTTACVLTDNIISGNSLSGVLVSGASAAGNLIWPNSITGNSGKGILLKDGGNMNLAAPTITRASKWSATGTSACPNCGIALYSDDDDEGKLYAGVTQADGQGNWTYAGFMLGPHVTATAMDGSGNTSEFSAPFDTSTISHLAFVPQAMRDN
jgi:CSLREA domain-containing protein